MTDPLQVGAWLPKEWDRHFTDEEKGLVAESDIDLLLIPENHDKWENRDEWKQVSNELGVALYAGFEDGDWIRGIFYDPLTGTDLTYTKHSSAGKLALEQEDWQPEDSLHTLDFRGITVGTTICHDHYFSMFMGYEGMSGASLLVNLSATPVQRKKWGEVLQARAIENCAYTVCTMHGTSSDGSSGRGHGHVFAFDPFGEQLSLTELKTKIERTLWETTPDNIYTFQVNPDKAMRARQSLTNQRNRPEITRIQNSTSDSATLSEPWMSVQGDYDGLRISYEDDSIDISVFESRSFSLEDEDFYLAVVEGENILNPEQLYSDILSVQDIENKRLLLLNHWSDLNSEYHRNVVEPVLRARCVEWTCPAVLVAPGIQSAYQVWYAKNSSRMIPDSEGRYKFFLYAARGVSKAFEPVHHETKKLNRLASVLEERRAKRD